MVKVTVWWREAMEGEKKGVEAVQESRECKWSVKEPGRECGGGQRGSYARDRQ